MLSIMTPNRKIIKVKKEGSELFMKAFFLKQANDGIFVPSCDLEQYNSGNRKKR